MTRPAPPAKHDIISRTFAPGIITDRLAHAVRANVDAALAEDTAGDDISSALIAADRIGRASVVAGSAAGVLAGCFWADAVFAKLDPAVDVAWRRKDGQAFRAGEALCVISGPLRAILGGERCALNFLQTLSGVASKTRDAKAALEHGDDATALLLDTRKTLPGLRIAQKYAVACGGGHNHRFDLSEMILIKDNHIRACGSITEAVARARARCPDAIVEAETETLEEVAEACDSGADIIMLDNFSLPQVRQAIALIDGRCLTEISGTEKILAQHDLADIARCGADFVSLGSLTKDVTAIDMSLEIERRA